MNNSDDRQNDLREMEREALSPLLVITGETASGKSSLALRLAQQFNGEIICADSWTVYKGFDIGTAKPTKQEQAIVPHHLLDIADPRSGFSAAVFQRLAIAAINSIAERGKLPIMTGGTGLYIDSVIYQYSFLNEPAPGLREALNALSLEALLERAARQGVSTEGIDERNKRRVIRLIENGGKRPTRQSLRANTFILGLQVPRSELKERIIYRVDSMLSAGLEGEVKNLASIYGWEVEPMKGIGYREWRPYFAGTQSLEVTRERVIKSTLELAKRQRTWFGRNKSIHWLSTPVNWQTAVEFVTTVLDT